MTKYRVLKKLDAPVSRVGLSDDQYVYFASDVEAHSPTQAIRKCLVGEEGVDGTYVAVPELNWTELPVALQAPAPRLVIGGIIEEPQLPLEPAEVS